jgi:FAD synthetase
MSLEALVSRYIYSAEHVLNEIEVLHESHNIGKDSVNRVVEHAKAYLDDARYYRDQNKLEVSLTSVAYCEGLLDALRMTGAVKFEWPRNHREK